MEINLLKYLVGGICGRKNGGTHQNVLSGRKLKRKHNAGRRNLSLPLNCLVSTVPVFCELRLHGFFFFFQRFVFLFKQLLLHGEVLLYHMVAFKFLFFIFKENTSNCYI